MYWRLNRGAGGLCSLQSKWKATTKNEDKGVYLRSLGFSIALRTEMDLGDTVVVLSSIPELVELLLQGNNYTLELFYLSLQKYVITRRDRTAGTLKKTIGPG